MFYLGDGSQLADSFENLSMYSQRDLHTTTSIDNQSCSDYENVKLYAPQAVHKNLAASPPVTKHPPGVLAGLTSGSHEPIREVWTPPCSPDYRDHTTSSLCHISAGRYLFFFSQINVTCHQMYMYLCSK